ncbi:helix-turn-helix domain-containing protein [Brevundimonas intermedia]|uniref:Helix-turn-helix domain-containing protein n=1 Tax=Brevundimonas intermedia TaxID=74315 RepID=A0A4Y9RRP2_9CAUL|nr:helix-turn-helix domain-containing protein [Brevundimonas intermedia]TFW11957.1 helix-turn-helix domain-containing protein [Brevundimonas intermedia]
MALNAGAAPDAIKTISDRQDPTADFANAASLGEGLRHARERSGKSLAELAAETKVHRRFLTALEQNDWSSLPSRVFALGYVRAYASALFLDEQLAVERFKRESPDTSVPLKAPIGIAFEDVKRHSPRIVAGVVAVVVAVIGWNVFQRASLHQAAHPSDIAAVPKTWVSGVDPDPQLALSAPMAAPPDQTTPQLYITPGLEAQLTGVDPAVIAAAANPEPVQKAFNPRGAVYGAPANASMVVIQAKTAGALVVRLGDGQALFARQMAPGEAWRAPIGVAATVDVSDPAAFDLYLNGEYGGPLAGVLTPLAQLNSRADQAAKQLAATQARAQVEAQAAQARTQAQTQTSAPSPTPTTPN